MSGIDSSEPRGKSSCISMPLAAREIFPPTLSASERVWLGPMENSLSKFGLMVLTRLREKFHPGCFCTQPPVKLIDEEHAKMPNGPGKGSNGALVVSELWIQRPKMRF